MNTLLQILAVSLSAAPWLLLGLLIAGMIKAWVNETLLQRWVGGEGLAATARAAVIGAPLPLCSCGAIPTALTLHKGGAGRGPTTAFLIGTPGIGADSLAISYALLGPVMMVARAIGAIATAIATGLLVGLSGRQAPKPVAAATSACGSCCGSSCGTESKNTAKHAPPATRVSQLRDGLHYAFDNLLTDIGPWLLAGLVIAGALMAWLPPQALADHGSGLLPMLLMAVVGIPLYICATAATPIAASMLVAGMSPGTVLVFLLAGLITSAATLGLLRREFGNAGVSLYLVGIVVCAIVAGLLLDAVLAATGINPAAHVETVAELLPEWLEWSALLVLLWFGSRPLRDRVFKRQSPHAQH